MGRRLKMALSDAFTANVGTYMDIVAEWTGTPNIAGNYTTVNVKLYLQSGAYGDIQAGNVQKEMSISIDGSVKTFTNNVSINPNQKRLLGEHTVNVYHNSDGTKSFPMSASVNFQITYNGVSKGVVTANSTQTLNPIGRASTMSLSANRWFGVETVFTINKANSGFSHRITYMFAGQNGVVSEKTTAGSVAWVIPANLMNHIPDKTKEPIGFTLETWNGNTMIGTNFYLVEAIVRDTVVPSISSVSIVESDAGVVSMGLSGNFLQGMSNIKMTVSTNVAYSSPIVSYQFKLSSLDTTTSSNVLTHNLIEQSWLFGTQKLTIVITDRRGRTATKEQNINIIAYSQPRILSFKATRTTGTNVKFDYDLIYSDVKVGGVEKNEKVAHIYIGSTHVHTLTPTAKTATFSGYAVDKSYEFTLKMRDKISLKESKIKISTAKYILTFYQDKGLGVGKVYEDTSSALDVGGKINLNGNNIKNGGFESQALPAGNAYVPSYWRGFLPNGYSWWFYNPESAGVVANMLNSAQMLACFTDGYTIFIQSLDINGGRAYMRISGENVARQWTGN